ncbi:ankyrin repeat [Tropilaelaps mercedesae]|uniref:Ankyrin repeat n=1 Tax=Tropilaelaps mercedesae TaxID=418985 RepID=A0A1V9XLM9_9ACAR|nr:ankyrin repeat [Tropilaelaps mercedesae]
MITLKNHTALDIAEINGKRHVADTLRVVTQVPPLVPRSPVPSMRLATVIEEPVERDKAKSITQSEKKATLNNNENNINCLIEVSPARSKHTNEDLYLFLFSLDLLNYLPLLQAHRVDFHTLLLFEDSDLKRVGIAEAGARKKLLAAIFKVHRQPWRKNSLSKLSHQNLNCHDVQEMLADLTFHMDCMRSSVAFILRQLEKDDTVLSKEVQANGGIDAIFYEHQLLMFANDSIRCECVKLQRHLAKLRGYSQYPLISYGRIPESKQAGLVVLTVAVVASVGAMAVVGLFMSRRTLI